MGSDPDATPHLADVRLKSRLNALTFIRLAVVTVLFAVVIIQHIQEYETYVNPHLSLYYGLILSVYLSSLFFLLVLKRLRRVRIQAYIQLLFDALVVTGFIYASGGAHSIFTFLYFLNIFSAAALLYQRGAWTLALADCLLYGWIYAVDFYNLLPQVEPILVERVADADTWTKLAYTDASFILIALLSGYLAEGTRRVETELDTQAEELRDLEAFNRNIVLSMLNGLVLLDKQGRVTYANAPAARYFGENQEMLAGHAIADLFQQRDWDATALEGTKAIWEQQIRGVRGLTCLKFSSFPYQDEAGNVMGRLLVMEDLSELKAMELRAQKAEWLGAIGQMTAGIAHEIKNPLASMSGALELLQDEPALYASPDNQRLFDIIHRETKRLTRIVNDFLAFARPQQQEIRPVLLLPMVEETLLLLQSNHKIGENISVLADVPEGLCVSADPALLRQVLWNLINNAVEAMPNGGKLTLRAMVDEDSDGCVVSIEDTGPGIPFAIRKHLFEPFFSTKKTGSGLGLATVQRIMDVLGGRVEIESEEGVGTDVRFHLPVAHSVLEEASEEEGQSAEA